MSLTVAQLVARLTADTSGFYRSMAIANSSMIRTGSVIGRVAAGAGIAVGAMGFLSLRAAGNFQQAMNMVQAVSGATDTQFNALREEAIALGRDFKLPNVSAMDAADAMVELSKGGLSVNQTLRATRGALQLGLAANIDFADSATLIARSLKAFDLGGNQAMRVTNLLAAAANRSTADIDDLALGMQNAAAQFHGVGYSAESLTASLAILSDNALSGEYAGTALKTMIIRLTSPTDKAAKVMKNFGIEVFDSQGKMKQMPQVIKEFTDGLGGLTQQQREQALTTIFGVRANQAMRILMGEGSQAFEKYEKSITGTNAAIKITEARTKGFNGALGAAGSAVETLAIELGTALLPSAEAAVRAFARFVASIDPDKIIAFFSAIKDGIVAFASFVQQSDAAQYILAALASAFVGLLVAKELIGVFRALQAAWLVLNASFVASPIGLVVVALAALAGALVLAYMKSEQFRAAVDAAFSWLKENVLPIIEDIVNGIRAHWDEIVSDAKAVLGVFLAWWNMTWGRVASFVINHWREISNVINAVLQQILIMIRGVLKTIQGVINLVMGIIKGDWGRAWEGIKQILDGTLGTMMALIKNTLTKIVPAVLRLALEIGKAIVKGILNGIGDILSWLGGKLKSGITGAITAVVGWAGSVAATIGKAIMDGILSGLTGLAGALAGKIKGALGSAFGAVKSFAGIGSPSRKAADEIGKPLGEGIIVGYLLGVNDLPDKMKESLRSALEKGKQVVEEYQQKFEEAFSQLISDALEAFDRITEAHRTKSEKLLDKLVSQHDADAFKRRLDEARIALDEANRAVQSFDPSGFGTPGAAQEELDRRQAALASAQQAWDDLMYEQHKAQLEKKAEKERTNYADRRAIQRRHLESELEQLQTFLLKHPQMHNQTQKKIIKLLHDYGIQYRAAGFSTGMAFAKGLEDSFGEVLQRAKEIAAAVASVLKTGSPTKEGPMSDLDNWWDSFGKTLVSGLDDTPVKRAALGLAGMMRPTAGGGFAYGQSGSSTTGGGTVIYKTYNVQGSLIKEEDLNDRIREAINTEARRGRSISV